MKRMKDYLRKSILLFILSTVLVCQKWGWGAYDLRYSYAGDLSWPTLDGRVLSEGAILIDADSGTVLYAKNEHNQYFPASITKVLTAILVLENVDNLEDKLIFSHNAVVENLEPNSTIIGAVTGDELSVRDCLYCLLLHSANDCANALAEYVAGSNEEFAEMMNQKALELGCTDSHFVNPSGLNDPEHYTSCSDMAKILQYAIKNPTFLRIEASQVYKHGPLKRYQDPSAPENTIYAHHKMMRKSYREYYEGVIAGKTGYTVLAGNTLVTACERNGMTLICVILNGHNSQYIDSKTLFDFGFENFRSISAADSDRTYSSLKNHLEVDGIALVNMLEFKINKNDHITIPKAGDMNRVLSSLSYALTDVEKAGGALARVDYTYGERNIGRTYIYLEEPEEEDYQIKEEARALVENASQGSEGVLDISENSIVNGIRSPAEFQAQAHSERDGGNAPLVLDKQQGKIIVQKPVLRVLALLGVIAAFVPLFLLGDFLYDRHIERLRKKRRFKFLVHTSDLNLKQKSKRDLLLNKRQRPSKRGFI